MKLVKKQPQKTIIPSSPANLLTREWMYKAKGIDNDDCILILSQDRPNGVCGVVWNCRTESIHILLPTYEFTSIERILPVSMEYI